MNDWQISILFLSAVFGSIFGGLLGYAKAKKADPSLDFQWTDLIITLGTGLLSGAGGLLAANLSEMQFGAAAIITVFVTGMGVDYGMKKTVLTKIT